MDNPPLASSDTAKFKIILAEGTRENWSKIDKAFAEIDKLLERNGERWDEYFREKVAERIRNMESSINVLQWGMGVLGAGAATIIGLLIYLLTHGHSA